mmetsp:Transcript_55875/g.161827  ORF Transcript_55875/g.161827 Transcript_55875/m.161827 type:complete len:256 (-) Transcript_55875:174-941(-)
MQWEAVAAGQQRCPLLLVDAPKAGRGQEAPAFEQPPLGPQRLVVGDLDPASCRHHGRRIGPGRPLAPVAVLLGGILATLAFHVTVADQALEVGAVDCPLEVVRRQVDVPGQSRAPGRALRLLRPRRRAAVGVVRRAIRRTLAAAAGVVGLSAERGLPRAPDRHLLHAGEIATFGALVGLAVESPPRQEGVARIFVSPEHRRPRRAGCLERSPEGGAPPASDEDRGAGATAVALRYRWHYRNAAAEVEATRGAGQA